MALSEDEDIALQRISGILRLSTKYEFQAMRKEAIRMLEIINPIELDKFMTLTVARSTRFWRKAKSSKKWNDSSQLSNCPKAVG